MNNIKFSSLEANTIYDEDDVFGDSETPRNGGSERNCGYETEDERNKSGTSSRSSERGGRNRENGTGYDVREVRNGDVETASENGGASESSGYILLNIDRRQEEMSRSTETIVNNGDGDVDARYSENRNDENSTSDGYKGRSSVSNGETRNQLEENAGSGIEKRDGESIDQIEENGFKDVQSAVNGSEDRRHSSCHDNEDDCGQSEGRSFRQRPSIVINHCDSIDQTQGPSVISDRSNVDSRNNDIEDHVNEFVENEEIDFLCRTVNSSERDPEWDVSDDENRVLGEIIVKEICKIDDNQNFVNPLVRDRSEPLMRDTKSDVVTNRSVPNMASGFSMANLVYNMIVDKTDTVTNDENSVDAALNADKTDEKDTQVEEIIETTKNVNTAETQRVTTDTNAPETERYNYYNDTMENIRHNTSNYKSTITNISSVFEDVSVNETPVEHLNIVVVPRNMKNIDDMNNVQLLEDITRDAKKTSEKETQDKSKVSSLNSVKTSSSESKTEENAVENSKVKRDSEELAVSVDKSASTEHTNSQKSPFGGSIADLVYNLIVDKSSETDNKDDIGTSAFEQQERPETEQKHENVVDDVTSGAPTIVLNTVDENDSQDNLLTSNESKFEHSVDHEVDITNSEHKTEVSNASTSDVDEASNIPRPGSSNSPTRSQNLGSNHSLTPMSNLGSTTSLSPCMKRTKSEISLRDEILEIMGPIEHEKSPDLDDLLSSIGPISTHDVEYDSQVEGETYESDFDEDFREMSDHANRGRRQYHSSRRRSSGISGKSTNLDKVSDDEQNGNRMRSSIIGYDNERTNGSEEKRWRCRNCSRILTGQRRNSDSCRNRANTCDGESPNEGRSRKSCDSSRNRNRCGCQQGSNQDAFNPNSHGNEASLCTCASQDTPPDNEHPVSPSELYCDRCYRPSFDYSMLDETCHLPVIKSIDKIISTLENVLEPLENALEPRDNSHEPQEQINDSATESEISCHYKRRERVKGRRNVSYVETLNGLIAEMNHITGKLYIYLLLKKKKSKFILRIFPSAKYYLLRKVVWGFRF